MIHSNTIVAHNTPAKRKTGTSVVPLALVLVVSAMLTALHVVAVLEGPGWSSPLLLGDHLFVLGLSLALLLYCYALGRFCCQFLLSPTDSGVTAMLVCIGLGSGIMSTGILLLGFARLYYSGVFVAAFVLATVLLRHELQAAITTCAALIGDLAHKDTLRLPSRGLALVLVIITISFGLAVVRIAVPISSDVSGTDWDGLVYHVEAPSLYIQAHRLIPLPLISIANAPAAEDMLFVPALYASAETVAKALNIPLTLLMALAVYNLGKRSFNARAGVLSATILMCTLWLLPIVPTTLTDIAPSVLLIQALSDILVWASDRRQPIAPSRPTQGRTFSWLGQPRDILILRAGLLTGVAASMRLSDAPAAMAIAVVAGLVALWRSEVALPLRLVLAIRTGMLAAVAILLPLAPWLLKNRYFFGNPLYPQVVESNTTTHSASAAATLSPAAGSHLDHIAWLLTTLPQLAWQYVTPLAVVLMLAPIMLRGAAGFGLLAFLVVSGLLWLEFVPIYLPPRYMLVFVAAVAVAVAAAIQQIDELPKRVRTVIGTPLVTAIVVSGILWLTYIPFTGGGTTRLVLILFAQLVVAVIVLEKPPTRLVMAEALEIAMTSFLCLTALVGLTLQYREYDKNNALTLASGSISRDAYLATHTWYFRSYQWVNSHTARETVVAIVHITPTYYLERSFVNDWYGTTFRAMQNSIAARPGVYASWCGAHVSVLIFSRRLNQLNAGFGEMAQDVRPLSSFSWLHAHGLAPRLLYSANGVDVLRITPCSAR